MALDHDWKFDPDWNMVSWSAAANAAGALMAFNGPGEVGSGTLGKVLCSIALILGLAAMPPLERLVMRWGRALPQVCFSLGMVVLAVAATLNGAVLTMPSAVFYLLHVPVALLFTNIMHARVAEPTSNSAKGAS